MDIKKTLKDKIGEIVLNSPIFKWGLLTIFCIIMGLGIVEALDLVVIFVGGFMGVMLFQFPSYVWIYITLAAAVCSRFFSAELHISSIINFFHYPLIFGAMFISLNSRYVHQSQIASSIGRGIMALLLFSFISWMINGGELLRPILTWLVFCEPFLLIYVLLKNPPDLKVASKIWKYILVIMFIQIPICLYQAVVSGTGDPVRGTFTDCDSGAHVVGSFTLCGSLICVAKGSLEKLQSRKIIWIIGAVLLFSISLVSDAKQSIVCFIPGLFIVIFACYGINKVKLLLPITIFTIVLFCTFYFYQPFRTIAFSEIYYGLPNKMEESYIIISKIGETPVAWIWGMGPGNTVSRVALLTSESVLLKEESAVSSLGLEISPITEEILTTTFSRSTAIASSAWSGLCSWLGLIGDLGIIGVGIYLWMGWKLWQATKQGISSWEDSVARASLLLAGLLGFISVWLEEPGFMLTVAIIVGLALCKKQVEIIHSQNP